MSLTSFINHNGQLLTQRELDILIEANRIMAKLDKAYQEDLQRRYKRKGKFLKTEKPRC